EEEQEGFAGTAGRPKAVSDGHDGKIWALDLEDWDGQPDGVWRGGLAADLLARRDGSAFGEEESDEGGGGGGAARPGELCAGSGVRCGDQAAHQAGQARPSAPPLHGSRARRGRPGRPDDQFGALDRDGNSVTGSADIDASWNAVARTSSVAQNLLFLIFRSKTIHQLLAAPQPPPLVDPLEHPSDPSSSSLTGTQSHNSLLKNNKKDPPANLALELRDLLKVLLAYSDRNLVKIDKTVQESFLIEFLLNQFN
ncbi:hypothetical protein PCANC_28502, partial [Puccinia coronata f. sp. avenae]